MAHHATQQHPALSPWRWLGRLGLRGCGWLAIVLDHFKPIRIALLLLVVGSVMAVAVDQAAELFLIALWTDPSGMRFGWLLLSCALAGLAIWYATRNAYRLIYPRWPALQDPRAAGLRSWLPRLLGAAVPVLVLLGFLLALRALPHGQCDVVAGCARRWWRVVGLLLEAGVLIGFFITRRWFWEVWYRRRGKVSPLARSPSSEHRAQRLGALGRTPLRVFGVALTLNVLATILVAWWPQLLDGIGPLAILLIAASFMSLSGTFLSMAADRRGLPLLSVLLLITGLLHGLHLNDNHRVRQYPAMNTHQLPAPAPAESRPSFDAYAQAWLDSRCRVSQPCPVVMVSTEGGGIRSAAWTALVLSRLTALVQARHPGLAGEPLLSRSMFAASGVSGGSLGLATYVALLRQPGTVDTAQLEARAQSLLGHDFLSPTLANLLFVDFTQRWLPGAWFDDRGRALTRAWEQAAKKQGVSAFAQPFSALYQKPDGSVDTGSPALFLNSTTVAEGRRFIQHPFRALATPQQQPWVAAFDGSTYLQPSVPLSEAVLNSARFTYISPAGTVDTVVAKGAPQPLPATMQLVDGGYFENSGTSTLLEVMHQLQRVAAVRGQALRFIVLHISNDAQLNDFVSAHDPAQLLPLYSSACPQASPLAQTRHSGEVVAPLKALLDTRSARGDYAREQLLEALHVDRSDPARGDVLWHFRLCPGDYPMPLGWELSAPVFGEMRRQLQQNYPLQHMAQTLDRQLTPARP